MIDIPSEKRNDPVYIKKILSESDNSIDVEDILNTCGTLARTAENIELAINKGYIFKDAWRFENDPEFIYKYLKVVPAGRYDINNIINNCNSKMLTNEVIDLAFSKGYRFENKIPKNLIKNSYYIKKVVASLPENDQNINIVIDNAHEESLEEDTIFMAIDKGYKFYMGSNKIIMNNPKYIKRLIDKGDTKQIYNVLQYASESGLTSDNIKLAISRNINIFRVIINNDKASVVKELLNCNLSKEEVILIGNNINYDILDDDIIKLLIDKGYTIDKSTPIIIRSNSYAIRVAVLKNVNNINYAIGKSLTDNLTLAISNGYEVTRDSSNEIIQNDNLMKIYYEELTKNMKDNSIYMPLISKYGYGYVYLGIKAGIFLKEIIDVLGMEAVDNIFKYIYMKGEDVNLSFLLSSDEREKFFNIYKILTNKEDLITDFNVLEFEKIYNNYPKLKRIPLNHDNITEEEKILLKKIYVNNNIINESNMTQLRNINKYIYDYNDKIITSNNIDEIKGVVYNLISNSNGDEIKKLITKVISRSKLERLKQSINDEKITNVIEEYLVLVDFLEGIYKSKDIDMIRNIAKELNKIYVCDQKILNNIWEKYQDIMKKCIYLYGLEVRQKLSKVYSYEKEKDKYEASSLVLEDGTDISHKKVDYIEISGNYNFFVHKMNAFGKDGKIISWKKPLIKGKSYICLSLVSEEITGIEYDARDINNVTLLFDDIDPSNLVNISSIGASTKSSDNNLNIECKYTDFDVVDRIKRITALNTECSSDDVYNEYTFYRESLNNKMYPKAVVMYKTKPLQVEIDAAAYLGVPLIKLNTRYKSYIGNKYYDEESNNDNNEKLNNIKKLLLELGNEKNSSHISR